MDNTSQSGDILEHELPDKRPELLSVLTILTFLGSGIGLVSSIWAFLKAKKAYETVLNLNERMDGASALARRFMNEGMVEVARKTYENRLPILVFGLAGLVCCTYGAIQMRKLKKTGFYVWTVGELLPVVSTILFIGGKALGTMSMFLEMLLPAVFILLYASQRKYMVN